MVIGAAFMRLLPHPWNFTPVAAMALFAGAHFQKNATALLVPLGALLLSDLFLGFHSTMVFVYGAFALTVLLGTLLRSKVTSLSVLSMTLVSAVMFFVVTNMGVWLVGGLYEKTMTGLAQCFVAAIPFFRMTLVGDVFYAAVLFGSFAVAEKSFPVLLKERQAVLQ
jgi:hypothetical protein